ncbi:MAG TPA: preprotein translocase subunit SecE [Thermoleophilaceae bacterium]|nr:preprotein translocase subunit SecE [Thermoleophilaceae bacterium]
MAKDRQRAKQRQAQRRAQRQSEERARTPGAPRPGTEAGGDGQVAPDEAVPAADGAGSRGFEAEQGGTVPAEVGVETGADLAASAPPEDVGRSDTVVETPPPPLAADTEEDPEAAAARGRPATGDEAGGADAHGRGRVVAFLVAVWAELKRVQWPNRQQITTLTGVVIAFVIIMGAYLGALDAVFSRLIRALI